MRPDRWKRLQELFDRAVEMEPAPRKTYLDEACGDDREMLRQVESLILAGDQVGSFLEDAVQDAMERSAEEPIPTMEGERLGAYEIRSLIDRGGMGEVYLAVRADDEFDMQVAIKVVRSGLETPEQLRRFQSERQILATLDHPGIANLLDGGTSETGVPYLVMEYVEGEPVDRYCDRNCLTTDQRLDLFRSICEAVQFAHQNLVVHRDLKPSNILVTAEGKPKLLDFGIAKLLDPALSAYSLAVTATGMRLLTPDYASPEQVRGDTITTASDVYSLGVLLYELLTGRRPHRFKTRTPSELERVICETYPERPSTAVTRADPDPETGNTPETVSQARGTRPDRLKRRLSGDLDNIVLMALRKEPARRYASVQQMAQDIERHQRGLPVAARKDTWRYRGGKFVRRNRLAVGAAAAFTMLLAGFGVTMAVQADRIAEERDRANLEAETARQTTDFLVDLFEVTNPSEAKGDTLTVRELLDTGAERVRSDLADQPLVQARLLNTMGIVYRNLGLYEESRPLLEDGLAARRRELGDTNPEVAKTLHNLGILEVEAGNYDLARAHYLEALRIQEDVLESSHPDLSLTLTSLGQLLRTTGAYDSALVCYERALTITMGVYGENHEDTARIINNMAVLQSQLGNLETAEPLLLRALEINESLLGEDHPDLGKAYANLAVFHLRAGDFEKGRPLLERALAIFEKALGPDHPAVGITLGNLAYVVKKTGDLPEARRLEERALELAINKLGPEHPEVGISLMNLGSTLKEMGEFDEAKKNLLESRRIILAGFGPEHIHMANVTGNIGNLEREMGNFEIAAEHLARAADIARIAMGPEALQYAGNLYELSRVERWLGKPGPAEEHDRIALDVFGKKVGENDGRTVRCLMNLAILHADQGNATEADSLYRLGVARFEEGVKGVSEEEEEYLRACYWSAAGEPDQALDALARAVELGYTSPFLFIDPDLTSLREEPRFREITVLVQGRLEAGS